MFHLILDNLLVVEIMGAQNNGIFCFSPIHFVIPSFTLQFPKLLCNNLNKSLLGLYINYQGNNPRLIQEFWDNRNISEGTPKH